LQALVTQDVRAWSPGRSTASLAELIDELDRQDDAFSDVHLDVAPLDVGGEYACVEWTASMTHSGTILLADDTSIEASGIRISVHGVTIAEFAGERICSLRQYWDEEELLEQLGVLTRNRMPEPTATEPTAHPIRPESPTREATS
jgi:hypothetical protein